jgi:prepilin-type N-terminal cleavage/methylation domain-containing protein/prepilin-type processing-associated H-X9-DG protein
MTAAGHPSQLRRRGFTLIELLVVIVIVAALATLSYSGSRTMITRARIIESSANLRSLAIANTTYVADNGVYCPAMDQSTNRCWHGTRIATSERFDSTKGFLSPYLGKDMRVSVCPLFRAIVTGSSSFEDGSGGYGYNAQYIGGLPGGKWDASKILLSQRPANVTNPSRTVMFTTTACAKSDGLQEYPFCEPPFWDFGSGPSGSRPTPSVHFRADGKAIVAWCDGHVSLMEKTARAVGINPYGGNADEENLGWFGPDENNGWWNPKN